MAGRIRILTVETPGLGDRSYLVHDGDAAFVVDPQRDIDRVVDLAVDAGVTITHVFETHVHNDYVSGGLALARRTGSTLVAGAGSDYSFEYTAARDRDHFVVGTMVVTALHTPGHTHDHHSYAVTEGDGDPVAVFTGGSLLYGTVGRTDLLGEAETDELTRAQWASARRLASELPADAAVHPTHGFGSFCASQGGGDRDESTIGRERDDNLALRIDDVDRFVEHLLDGLAEYPAYYAHMALLNRAGATEPALGHPEPVDGDELRRRLLDGEWVLDLRDRRAYAHGHLVGTAGFEVEGPLVTYVGWIIPWGSRLTLLGADADQVRRAQRELARIGIDQLGGAATGEPEEMAAGHPMDSYPVASFAELADAMRAGPVRVVDVRRSDEHADAHVEGAVNLPVHELLDHLHHAPQGPLWVHCESGARAAIAASLLRRAGYDVVLIDDRFDDAEAAGVPVRRSD